MDFYRLKSLWKQISSQNCFNHISALRSHHCYRNKKTIYHLMIKSIIHNCSVYGTTLNLLQVRRLRVPTDLKKHTMLIWY